MTLTFGKKNSGRVDCINYEFNMLDHVGAVAKTDIRRHMKGATITLQRGRNYTRKLDVTVKCLSTSL